MPPTTSTQLQGGISTGGGWLQGLLQGASNLIPNIDVNIGGGGTPTPQQVVPVAALIAGTAKPHEFLQPIPGYQPQDLLPAAKGPVVEPRQNLIASDNNFATDANVPTPAQLAGGYQPPVAPQYGELPAPSPAPLVVPTGTPGAQSNVPPEFWTQQVQRQAPPNPYMNPYVMQNRGQMMMQREQLDPYIQAGPYRNLPAIPPPVPVRQQPGIGNLLRGIAGAAAPGIYGRQQAADYATQAQIYNDQLKAQQQIREQQERVWREAMHARAAANNTMYQSDANMANQYAQAMAGPKFTQGDYDRALDRMIKNHPEPGPPRENFIANVFHQTGGQIDLRDWRGQVFPREVAIQDGRDTRNQIAKEDLEHKKAINPVLRERAQQGLLRDQELNDVLKETKAAQIASKKLGAELNAMQKQIMAPKAANANESNRLDMMQKAGALAAQQRALLDDQFRGNAAIVGQWFKYQALKVAYRKAELNPNDDRDIAGLKGFFGEGMPQNVKDAMGFMQQNFPQQLGKIRQSGGKEIPDVGPVPAGMPKEQKLVAPPPVVDMAKAMPRVKQLMSSGISEDKAMDQALTEMGM